MVTGPRRIPPPLIVLAGATATGKSDLAIALAEQLDGEVINGDAMQLYCGMDIGTAKVTPAQRRLVPHHQIDVLDVTQEASVARYQRSTRELVDGIRARGRTPILVGGSGLYLRAVLDVIDIPPTEATLRDQLTSRLADEGAEALRAELRRADPVSAETVRDDRRLVRALEVVLLTGKPFSSFMPRREYHPAMEPVFQLGLSMDRAVLHERIHRRVQQMAQAGLLEEVRELERRGLRGGRTASRAIGYQQFLAVLDGASTEAEAIDATVTATRKLARKQETWFRADPRIHWIPGAAQGTREEELSVLRRALEILRPLMRSGEEPGA